MYVNQVSPGGATLCEFFSLIYYSFSCDQNGPFLMPAYIIKLFVRIYFIELTLELLSSSFSYVKKRNKY